MGLLERELFLMPERWIGSSVTTVWHAETAARVHLDLLIALTW
jgi:hypothetical protein